MSDFKKKAANLEKAVQRLQETIKEYEETKSDSVRDGGIQRFEFCMELAWKTAREYLLDQGFVDINSPKAVMREAYSYGILNDETIWINALTDRNLTSHVYDEKVAYEIFSRIQNDYVSVLKELSQYFAGK